MPEQWTEPIDDDWGVGDLVTSEMMMGQVINNLRYLHNLGDGIMTGYSESVTLSSNSWGVVEVADSPNIPLNQSVEIGGDRDVLLLFVTRVRMLTVPVMVPTPEPVAILFDFSFDKGLGPTRVGTMITGSGNDPDRGLYRATLYPNDVITVVLPWILNPAQLDMSSPGNVTFKVQWRLGTTGATLKMQNETAYLFAVRELP